ncbi:mtDNA inheritance, partitioning of the mitochondrial organelle [Microbotryomycetes sp. JL201]|nr:mtDNA inheritance, partitioning of the mitochondrial organelle [Microbotryomycetes sp. JL201]
MEAVLVTRNTSSDAHGNATTSDLRLTVQLPDAAVQASRQVKQLPETEWPGSSTAGLHPDVAEGRNTPVDLQLWRQDRSVKTHVLARFSAFGADDTNEFATFVQGKEVFLDNTQLRDSLEEDMRSFAERSDHTEGFMLSTSISDGFGGLSSGFIEQLRDEHAKACLFTTAMLKDAHGWKRHDTEVNIGSFHLISGGLIVEYPQRSQTQRTLNAALSLHTLEEFSTMLLPVQPPAEWQDAAGWTRYLRQDIDRRESYSYVLNAQLQSMNTELREPGVLDQVVSQLNWRGDNKIAHLAGSTPMLPPHHLEGLVGQRALLESIKDFSLLGQSSGRPRKEGRSVPYAQYAVVRGFDDDDVQKLGPVLEASTPLKEPLSTWVCLPQPYPILKAAPPVFRSLLPNGRPLDLKPPPNTDVTSRSAMFGLPDPLFLHTQSTYYVQPESVPVLTMLSTTPDARHYLRHLSDSLKELVRTRSRLLYEYEDGEHGIGRDGVREIQERLETLADTYSSGATGGDNAEEEDRDVDEDWSATEQRDELEDELMAD